MKILIISETIHAGGAETFVLRLARKLIENGEQAEILSLNKDLENQNIIAQFPDVKIHHLNLPYLKWIKRIDKILKIAKFDFSMQLFLLKKIITKKYISNYDVFHSHLFPVDYLMVSLKIKFPKLKLVSTLHGDYNEYETSWNNGVSSRILNWPHKVSMVIKWMDHWVYISKNQKVLFETKYKVASPKFTKIYNGFEAPQMNIINPLPKLDTSLRFIMVSRGIRMKGWEFLMNAFTKLTGDHQLFIVGEGIFLDEMKTKFAYDNRIIFLGFSANPIEFIKQSDVFVFSSIYAAESLPTVIIEALYCGKPVISNAIGGIPEMIVDDNGHVGGILIKANDNSELVEGLFNGMSTYINDRSLLEKHGKISSRAFAKFNMFSCMESYLKIYKQ